MKKQKTKVDINKINYSIYNFNICITIPSCRNGKDDVCVV